MPKFMLIVQSRPNCFQDLSPEEMQRVFEKYRAWTDSMRATDRYVVGDKLKDEGGKIVSSERGKVMVVDGPYSEAREVVGGYITIRAANYDEAVSLVRDHPALNFGSLVIRAVDPMGCGIDE